MKTNWLKNLWKSSDFEALVVFELMLVALFLFAIVKAFYANFSLGSELTVGRGELSLNWLYFSYAATTVLCGIVVQTAEALKGHKVLIICADYCVLTYLFLFNVWFRNEIVFAAFSYASVD